MREEEEARVKEIKRRETKREGKGNKGKER